MPALSSGTKLRPAQATNDEKAFGSYLPYLRVHNFGLHEAINDEKACPAEPGRLFFVFPDPSVRFRSHRAGDLSGTQATGAGVDPLGGTVDDRLDPLDVRLPRAIGTPVRVRHADAESHALAAEIAFCHGSAPPSFGRRMIPAVVHILDIPAEGHTFDKATAVF